MWYAHNVPMFTCERCGVPYSTVNPGFVDRDGLPVHLTCAQPGEFEEYKNANNGQGYQLQLPGWETIELTEHYKLSAANRSVKFHSRRMQCVWIENRGKKIVVVGGVE